MSKNGFEVIRHEREIEGTAYAARWPHLLLFSFHVVGHVLAKAVVDPPDLQHIIRLTPLANLET